MKKLIITSVLIRASLGRLISYYMERHFKGLKMKWLFGFVLLTACVDKINFNVPLAVSLTIVEGTISDSPGPYQVKISKGISLDADSSFRDPIQNAAITLFDDEGNTESFSETSPGLYTTGGVIQGKIGHAYTIRIQTSDGKIFQSLPDTINPVGQVQQIKYEFEAKTTEMNNRVVDADIFNVYVDADAGAGNNYVRWRFTGTYKINTHPELHMTFGGDSYYKTPVPCSGYIVEPALGGGKLTQAGPCTCCTCWITQLETIPHLSDEQLVSNSQFRNVYVGQVPVNTNTFTDKYMVEVEQMSLTRNTFNFFKLIRAQKEGASSLFQPPSGKITGNLQAINNTDQVVGLFWATSIKSKYTFIEKSDVPYLIPPADFIADACTIYVNSSNQQPDFW